MSKNYAFKAEKRDGAGKGIARALRRDGRIPAVIYGDHKDPLNISLDSNDINVEYLKGHMFTNLCDLEVEGEKHLVLARDIQLHPVSDVVVHADFLRVNKKTMIAVQVPVHFINEETSPGLKAGGILSVVRHEIELMCSAMEIPESIEVDLGEIEIGDTAKLSHAKLPPGVKPIIDDRDFAIANISAPKVAVEEDEETAEAAEGDAAEGDAEAAEGEEGDAAEGDAE